MLLGSGCAIHPLPDNISRVNTFDIVKNIRCEAKYEVINQINYLLKRSPSPIVNKIGPREAIKKENLKIIKREYEKYPKSYIEEGREFENHDIAHLVRLFGVSGISYNFRFEITENNNVAGNAAFRFPFTNGIANFLIGGTLKLARLGKREFTMSENFAQLEGLQCGKYDDESGPRNFLIADKDSYEPLTKKFIYPLTGSVGMKKIMRDFLRLAEMGGGKGNFSDKITFTTDVGASLGSSVTVNPGPIKRLRIANAAVGVASSRQDVHEVIITLAFPDKRALREPPKNVSAKKALENIAEESRLEAAVAQCIQKAEAREDRFNVLRDVPPEEYCFRFAEALLQLPR